MKAAGDEELVGYQWVALGEGERESLGLSEKYESVGKTYPGAYGGTSHLFDEVAQTRGKTSPRMPGTLLYSREHEGGQAGPDGRLLLPRP